MGTSAEASTEAISTVTRISDRSRSLLTTVTSTPPTTAWSPSERSSTVRSLVSEMRRSWMPPATRMARPQSRATTISFRVLTAPEVTKTVNERGTRPGQRRPIGDGHP